MGCIRALHLIALLLLSWSKESSQGCRVQGDSWRFDCLPQGKPTQAECLDRGCCWKPPEHPPLRSESGISVPVCYFPEGYTSYNVTSTASILAGGIQLKATLQRASPYPKNIQHIVADFIYVDENILQIKIRDEDHVRWEVPSHLQNSKQREKVQFTKSKQAKYSIKVPPPKSAFGFQVNRKNGTSLLKTAGAFIFSDQFLQLSTEIPSTVLYGLGEHRNKLMINASWTRITLWNNGRVPRENENLYGSHPFYMCHDESNWFGVFLKNSNAMDIIIQPAPAVTWRPIGGIIDMYVMIGPTPSEVTGQYWSIVGRPVLPPYWALGFQLCWQHYGTANVTLATALRMKRLGIPQDVQWNDIDYAFEKRVFTLNPDGFGDQATLCQQLHKWGMHYVIIADCGIYNQAKRGTYEAYDLGVDLDIFIKDAGGKDLVGKVWPGSSVWPDFLSPDSQSYWTQVVKDFHHKVAFDGLWLDMNEITSFSDGTLHGCQHYNSSLDSPPYLPAVRGGALYNHTVCPSARHSISSHYNVHNLYGLYESIKTAKALEDVRGKRPFVISRATFPGQGQYSGHWSGDNSGTWYDMYKSISAMLHMNLYGVPLTGSDICGFNLNATEELCTRWHQLGAFYVFSRNHHSYNTIPQDPGSFSPASISSSRKALLTRYALLPHLYTLLWESHVHGTPVARPLFWTFPGDEHTFDIDSQFMWGSHLMISPVLREGERHVWAYFPKDVWYNFFSGEKIKSPGQSYHLPAPFDVINVHVRGGGMIHMQQPAQTTLLSRKLPFWLLVALNEMKTSIGQLYWDDGDSIFEEPHTKYNLIQYQAHKNGLNSTILHAGYSGEPMILGNVTVMGLDEKPSLVTLDGHPINFTFQNTVLYMTSFKIELTSKAFSIVWK